MRGLRKEELLQSDAQDKGFQARHARQGGVGGAQMSLTNRNLRIREDIPKYVIMLILTMLIKLTELIGLRHSYHISYGLVYWSVGEPVPVFFHRIL